MSIDIDFAVTLADAPQLLPEASNTLSHTFVPITLLDRSHFRLSYLDYVPTNTSWPSGCPFSADIPIFEEQIPTLSSKLLLAHLSSDGGLYIIEMAGHGAFVACRLRNWVNEDIVTAKAIHDTDDGLLGKLSGSVQRLVDHTQNASGLLPAGLINPRTSNPKRPKNKKGVLARMSILPKADALPPPVLQKEYTSIENRADPVIECKRSESAPENMLPSCTLPRGHVSLDTSTSRPQPSAADSAGNKVPELASSPSSQNLLESVDEVLLKTLYTLKTPLAYFTKSTLARTRATFRSSSTTGTSDLASFYRSRLIPAKKMDLKYRDTLPKIVQSFQPRQGANDAETQALSKDMGEKPKKRKGLGKDGLSGREASFVRDWWVNRDTDKEEPSTSDPGDQELKELLSELRKRETQLQIILILEILTLESAIRSEKDKVSTLDPESELAVGGRGKTVTEKSSETHKPRDLRPDLDILVDRLCIYQSVSSVDHAIIENASNLSGGPGKEVKDHLRDFCCNVVLPFTFTNSPPSSKRFLARWEGQTYRRSGPGPLLGRQQLVDQNPGDRLPEPGILSLVVAWSAYSTRSRIVGSLRRRCYCGP